MCRKSESITNLAVALAKFNSKVQRIEKDAVNPHYRNRYATLDSILDEVRPMLSEQGLSVIQMPSGENGLLKLSTMLLHISGEWIESDPIVMQPTKNDPQGIGSSTTYARRYGLCSFLGLSTGELDDDGNGASQQPTRPVQDQQPQTVQIQAQPQQNAQAAQVSVSQPVISTAQIGYCKRLQREKNISDDDFHRMVGEYNNGNDDIKQLPKKSASEFINFLNAYAA